MDSALFVDFPAQASGRLRGTLNALHIENCDDGRIARLRRFDRSCGIESTQDKEHNEDRQPKRSEAVFHD